MLSTHPETATTVLGLRGRLTKFLGNGTTWKKPLRDVIETIERERWRAVIFGGVIRDLAVFGPTERPRDVDIVLAGASTHEIERIFGAWIVRRTRFGGVRLRVDKWMFDIWDVSSTWGINQLGLDPNFGELPKTTFLNVEAVAAEISANPGRERKIYSSVFFKALEERIVNINFEENPFPALCVVRSLITAARLDFDIGRALAEYIVHHARAEGFRGTSKSPRSSL